MARGPVCDVENCGSTRYEEGEDGYLYCENGHRSGELLAGSDDDDFSTAARVRTRKKKNEDTGDVPKHVKISRAREHYLKCLQLILRHQIWFLIHEQGLPEELETVIQDLWALRILGFESEISERSQAFDSSQVDTDTDAERDGSGNSKMQETLNLVDCLILCYLGTLTLRLPILPGDFYTWTTEKGMPYRGAIRLLPIPMRDQLRPTFRNLLASSLLLSRSRFHSSLTNVQKAFHVNYGIDWPPLNIPILLFRLLKQLALPLEIYHVTRRLATLLGYDFTFHAQSKKLVRSSQLPEEQLFGCLVVCVKLIHPFDGARRYPKSTAEPTATRMDWSRWSSIMQKAKEQAKGADNKFTMEELANIQEMDGAQLDQYLDFYLDFRLENLVDEAYNLPEEARGGSPEAERPFVDPVAEGIRQRWSSTLSEEEESAAFDARMYEMVELIRQSSSSTLSEEEKQARIAAFKTKMYEWLPVRNSHSSRPVQTTREDEIQREWDVVQSVQSEMEFQTIIAEAESGHGIRRPGQDYVIYATEGDLPEAARPFYAEVARIGGWTMEKLVSVVYSTEMAIWRWRKQGGREVLG